MTQPPVPPAPPPYGQQPNPYGAPVGQDHPQATTTLILGILGLVLCSFVAPFAWAMGNRVLREIDASGGQYGGRSTANAGRICGIVGTVLLVFSVLALIGIVVIAIGIAATSP